MTESLGLRSKFLGGMVGSALGDAIGELAFGAADETALRDKVARAGRLSYTDDTAMAIGLAESITQMGRIDSQHLGDTFRANYRREPWRGYAMGPPTLFARVERQGLSYTEAAQGLFGGEGSYGNGAAMRIAPLGLFFHDAPDLYEQARRSAAVTHAHPIGIDGAAVLARAIGQAVRLDPQEPLPSERFVQDLVDFARTPELQDRLALAWELLSQGAPVEEVAWRHRLGSGVAMHESLPFALYAFLRYPQSFERCLFCAALNGGDRDTLGAMACAVSGAYLGLDAIPSDWRDSLENRQTIRELALELAEMAR